MRLLVVESKNLSKASSLSPALARLSLYTSSGRKFQPPAKRITRWSSMLVSGGGEKGDKECDTFSHKTGPVFWWLSMFSWSANNNIQVWDPVLDSKTFSTLHSWGFLFILLFFSFTWTWRFDYLPRVKQERVQLCG